MYSLEQFLAATCLLQASVSSVTR